MKRMGLATYIVSCVGVATFMSHFWNPVSPGASVLWPIAGACAIFSIYGGIIGRAHTEDKHARAALLASAIIGGLVLLGLTLSAIFLFVPRM
ncbi:MAG: hypothetical protein J7K77_02940 [Dehalococcoidales bacterium]|nr:hypothetical protein [Dehalococcoidales bacterium]